MNNRWIELKDLNEVAIAQKSGWEIEHSLKGAIWENWDGGGWAKSLKYRGRPAQPKRVTVTSECWRNSHTAGITYTSTGNGMLEPWQRFPAGDITGVVQE